MYHLTTKKKCEIIQFSKINPPHVKKNNVIFFTVIIPEVWSPPADWTGPDLPAVYRSFDNEKYVQLENGAKVVVGKVGHCEKTILHWTGVYCCLVLAKSVVLNVILYRSIMQSTLIKH